VSPFITFLPSLGVHHDCIYPGVDLDAIVPRLPFHCETPASEDNSAQRDISGAIGPGCNSVYAGGKGIDRIAALCRAALSQSPEALTVDTTTWREFYFFY